MGEIMGVHASDKLDLKIGLPNDFAETVKRILAKRSKFGLFTRFDSYGYGGFGEALKSPFEGDEYLLSPGRIISEQTEIKEKHPPFNNKELARKIAPSSVCNKIFFYARPVMVKGPQFLSIHYSHKFDPSGRPVEVVNALILNANDFSLIRDYLKKHPDHSTDIYYKIPTIIARENFENLDESSLEKIYKGDISIENPYLGLAAIYFFGPNIEERENQVVEWDEGKINVYNGEKKIKERQFNFQAI